jgi:hypothetical protein
MAQKSAAADRLSSLFAMTRLAERYILSKQLNYRSLTYLPLFFSAV